MNNSYDDTPSKGFSGMFFDLFSLIRSAIATKKGIIVILLCAFIYLISMYIYGGVGTLGLILALLSFILFAFLSWLTWFTTDEINDE